MERHEPNPWIAIGVGVAAILYGASSNFGDPQLSPIVVSGGAVAVAFGLMMITRAVEHPQTRLATWLITFQLLGVIILAVLAKQIDFRYLVGGIGVLAFALISIASVRERSSARGTAP